MGSPQSLIDLDHASAVPRKETRLPRLGAGPCRKNHAPLPIKPIRPRRNAMVRLVTTARLAQTRAADQTTPASSAPSSAHPVSSPDIIPQTAAATIAPPKTAIPPAAPNR